MSARTARGLSTLLLWVMFALPALLLPAMAAPANATDAPDAAAAAVPDTRSMIDALMPRPRERNLLVRPARQPAPDGAAATDPAPGLQPSPPPGALSLSIPFDTNSARLRPESTRVLGNLVAALLSPELKESRFAIEGHTDAHGAAAANLRLSQSRADAVRLFIVSRGVAPARLQAVGKGSSEPLDGADPLAPQNRRVRVVPLP